MDLEDMMDPEDMMPCGDCPVCDEMVDHSEAGFCADCGNAFHWTRCGTWWDGEHRCENCQEEEEDDD